MFEMKQKFLQALYKAAPFSLKGDLLPRKHDLKTGVLSCLICTSGRLDLLNDILFDLSRQTVDRSRIEIVVVNDSARMFERVKEWEKQLPFKYIQNVAGNALLGRLRNQTLEASSGEYILFLDDDTRIPDKNFLEFALRIMDERTADVYCPRGLASYSIVRDRYGMLDEFSFANRCCLHYRSNVEETGGFLNDLVAYEDVDLGIRLLILNKKIEALKNMVYWHPPLYFDSEQKPMSAGQAVWTLRTRYSALFWNVLWLSSIRYCLYACFSHRKFSGLAQLSRGIFKYRFSSKKLYRYTG